MSSPKSGNVDTRYSTTVPDLDDHLSPNALETGNTPALSPQLNPDPTSVPSVVGSPLTDMGPISRDFEQGNAEDGKAIRSDSQLPIHQLDPLTPIAGRATSRRVTHAVQEPRATSPSSSERSSSPPDSIDAFAEPRRRERANTIGSYRPSEYDELHRTVSGGTNRRRPVFENLEANGSAVFIEDLEQGQDTTNIEETSRIPRIDYEALEEFVAETRRARAQDPSRKKYSFSTQGARPLSQQRTASQPKITLQSPSQEKLSLDEKVDGSEKTLALLPSNTQEDRFTFFSTEIDKTIHAPDLGGLLDNGERFRDMFELVAEEGAWWLDVINPTKKELEMFGESFGIHRLTTEDISEKETREKVELFQTYYFVCFRSYNADPKSEDYLEPVNVYLVVFREGILSFAYAPNPHATKVRKRIGNRGDPESLTADWICYAMVDHIVDFYFPVLRSIEIEAEQIEDQVFVARAEDLSQLLRQIGECRKRVMTMMRLLGGKADVIKGFAKRCNAQYSVAPRVEIGLYLSDIQDHVVTMMSNLGHYEKMLSRSHSNYLAQLSVDHLIQGNRANEALSKITFIASILVPMNVICGVFGMNVAIPGGVNQGDSYAMFGGIIGVMVFIVLAAVIIGRRIRYI